MAITLNLKCPNLKFRLTGCITQNKRIIQNPPATKIASNCRDKIACLNGPLVKSRITLKFQQTLRSFGRNIKDLPRALSLNIWDFGMTVCCITLCKTRSEALFDGAQTSTRLSGKSLRIWKQIKYTAVLEQFRYSISAKNTFTRETRREHTREMCTCEGASKMSDFLAKIGDYFRLLRFWT